MSWEAAGFVKKQLQCPDGATLSRGQKLILFVLADYHDTRKRVTYPSVPTIAEEALSSLPQTKRDLAYLEEHFAIIRWRDGVGRGHEYKYKFVGLDLSLQDALRERSEREQKRVHGEPFLSIAKGSSETPFCPEGKGSERDRKGFMESTGKGSERVHGEQRNKEEPEPSTKPEPEPHAYGALKVWFAVKAELQTHLPPAEWALWVRPAYLLKVMSGDVLLISLPPNNRIIQAARDRKELLTQIVLSMGYRGVGFTHYPDDYTRQRLSLDYPEFYSQMYGNKKREASA